MVSPMRPGGQRCSILGLLAAVLALLAQIALGSVLPVQAALADPALFGEVPICHSGAPVGSDNGAPAGREQHGMQCALCPVCHALASAALLSVSEPPLAPPIALVARHTPSPPGRAPPVTAVAAATYPTGPPDLA